jgi:hypothetical protein
MDYHDVVEAAFPEDLLEPRSGNLQFVQKISSGDALKDPEQPRANERTMESHEVVEAAFAEELVQLRIVQKISSTDALKDPEQPRLILSADALKDPEQPRLILKIIEWSEDFDPTKPDAYCRQIP